MRPGGKFAGKPVLFPLMLHYRFRLVPLYAAICGTVALSTLAAAYELNDRPPVNIASPSELRSREPAMIDMPERQTFDAIVIGSGFGGAMAAHVLVHAGWRVLMLERGDGCPRGPASWHPSHAGLVSPFYSTESSYRVQEGRRESEAGGLFCVGGPSVFYGGSSLRYREADFTPDPSIHAASGARWPFSYAELEPFYTPRGATARRGGHDGRGPGRAAPQCAVSRRAGAARAAVAPAVGCGTTTRVAPEPRARGDRPAWPLRGLQCL